MYINEDYEPKRLCTPLLVVGMRCIIVFIQTHAIKQMCIGRHGSSISTATIRSEDLQASSQHKLPASVGQCLHLFGALAFYNIATSKVNQLITIDGWSIGSPV